MNPHTEDCEYLRSRCTCGAAERLLRAELVAVTAERDRLAHVVDALRKAGRRRIPIDALIALDELDGGRP